MASPGVVTTIVTHSTLPPCVAHARAFRSIKSTNKQSRTPRSTRKKTTKISTSSDIRQLIATANSTFEMLQRISPKIEELGTLLAQIQQRVTAIESKQGFNFNTPTSTQTHSPLRKVSTTNKVTSSHATMFPFFQSGIASHLH
jgi:Tfp pilus assembly protein PilO